MHFQVWRAVCITTNKYTLKPSVKPAVCLQGWRPIELTFIRGITPDALTLSADRPLDPDSGKFQALFKQYIEVINYKPHNEMTVNLLLGLCILIVSAAMLIWG